MTISHKPRFLISACLCGIPCKYDGTSPVFPLFSTMAAAGTALPLCPEVMGGLGVPRPPCEIRAGRVISRCGRDVTEQFTLGAQKVLRAAEQYKVEGIILKERSPSCGSEIIYDGTFSSIRIPGEGITASLLRKHGFPVWSEETFPPELAAAQM